MKPQTFNEFLLFKKFILSLLINKNFERIAFPILILIKTSLLEIKVLHNAVVFIWREGFHEE